MMSLTIGQINDFKFVFFFLSSLKGGWVINQINMQPQFCHSVQLLLKQTKMRNPVIKQLNKTAAAAAQKHFGLDVNFYRCKLFRM